MKHWLTRLLSGRSTQRAAWPVDPRDVEISAKELAERNRESWSYMVRFYEQMIAKTGWEHLPTLHLAVSEIARSPRAAYYRAGQSLWFLVISVKAGHGLEDGDPHVGVHREGGRWLVEYYDGYQLAAKLPCDDTRLRETIETMMDRLWRETRGRIASADVEPAVATDNP